MLTLTIATLTAAAVLMLTASAALVIRDGLAYRRWSREDARRTELVALVAPYRGHMSAVLTHGTCRPYRSAVAA